MAVRSITVSQLKWACLDPEWRRRWIGGGNPSTRSFGPAGDVPVQGDRFHRITDRFVARLTGADGPRRPPSASPAELWRAMYEGFAVEEINALLRYRKIESAYHLSQALRAFCGRLADLRKRTPGFRRWRDLFLAAEFDLRDIPFSTPAGTLFVSGRPDALRVHPEGGAEIVEYKLSRGADMKHDLLQLAVYARLLARERPDLETRGVLEYYEPELFDVVASRADLDAIFEALVAPVIPLLLTEKGRDAPPVPAPAAAAPSGLPGPTDLSRRIEAAYAAFKLTVAVIDRTEAPQLVRYRVRPSPGVKVVSLSNRAEDLQVALELPEPPLVGPAQGCVHIDIPRDRPDRVRWRDVVRGSAAAEHPSPVAFPVGVGVDNRVIMADLGEAATCHALVAGASGSGKSEFLKSLVAALILRNPPEGIRLTLIDPKFLTFGPFADAPSLAGPVLTDAAAAIPRLEAAAAEMDDRYEQLSREGYESLGQRFADGRRNLPYVVIVFDEFADLILAGREEKRVFEALVARLAAKGRAAGVHLILSTQRPDRHIVTGLIKSNLPLKVCMKVTSSNNSQIVLDQGGGERLLGSGDLLCDRGRGIERAQSPYVSREELLDLLAGRPPIFQSDNRADSETLWQFQR